MLETHTHADHVSGHGRLALEHGVPVAIHGAAGAEYPFEPARRRRRDRARRRSREGAAHPRPPARALLLAVTTGRATSPGSADGRLAASSARRAAGSRGRGARGGRGLFRSLERDARAARRGRGLPRPRRRLALRRGNELEGRRRRSASSGASTPCSVHGVEEFVAETTAVAGAAPAEHGADRRRSTAARSSARRRRSSASTRRTARVVLDVAPAHVVRGRPSARRVQRPAGRRRFGTKAGFVLRPTSDRVAAARALEPRRARRAPAARRRLLRHRRPARCSPPRATSYEPGRAGRAGANARRRTRSCSSTSASADERDARLHPGQPTHPLPAASRVRPAASTATAGRHDLLEAAPRAAHRREHSRRSGVDAGPCSTAASSEWRRRGGQVVAFAMRLLAKRQTFGTNGLRRCGHLSSVTAGDSIPGVGTISARARPGSPTRPSWRAGRRSAPRRGSPSVSSTSVSPTGRSHALAVVLDGDDVRRARSATSAGA